MNLAQKLQAYEKRHAPKVFPGTNNTRFPHWYCLTMYCDGSGYVKDSLKKGRKNIVFGFSNYKGLLEELEK